MLVTVPHLPFRAQNSLERRARLWASSSPTRVRASLSGPPVAAAREPLGSPNHGKDGGTSERAAHAHAQATVCRGRREGCARGGNGGHLDPFAKLVTSGALLVLTRSYLQKERVGEVGERASGHRALRRRRLTCWSSIRFTCAGSSCLSFWRTISLFDGRLAEICVKGCKTISNRQSGTWR